MYSTSWCGFCFRLKKVLKAEGIAFAEVDIETDPASAEFVASVNGGMPDGADAEIRRRQHADQPERGRGQGESLLASSSSRKDAKAPTPAFRGSLRVS